MLKHLFLSPHSHEYKLPSSLPVNALLNGLLVSIPVLLNLHKASRVKNQIALHLLQIISRLHLIRKTLILDHSLKDAARYGSCLLSNFMSFHALPIKSTLCPHRPSCSSWAHRDHSACSKAFALAVTFSQDCSSRHSDDYLTSLVISVDLSPPLGKPSKHSLA